MSGWVTFQNSCTATVLGSNGLCRHHVSSLTMGAVERAEGSGRALGAGLGPDTCPWLLSTHCLPRCAVVSVRLGLQSLHWPGRGQRVQRICRT